LRTELESAAVYKQPLNGLQLNLSAMTTPKNLFEDENESLSLCTDFNVEKLNGVRVLIVEGITALNDTRLADLCTHRFFIEIERETCRSRRLQRTYDPPDTADYFDKYVWPAYVSNLADLRVSGREIHYLNGQHSIQANCCRLLSIISLSND